MSHALNPLVSVTAGEWSPEMSSRIDLPNYRKACRRLRNMVPTKQGGATRRPGTVYIADGKGADDGTATPAVSRLEKFQFAPGTTFELEFCDKGIRFYSNGQQIQQTTATAWVAGTIYGHGNFVQSPANSLVYYCLSLSPFLSTIDPSLDSINWRQQTIYEVPSPYSGTNFTAPNYWASDVFVLQTKQINDVVYVVHPRFPVYKLTRFTDQVWTMVIVQFLTPAMLDQNVTDIYIGASALTGVTGLSANAGAWATATYYQPSNAVNQTGTLYKCLKSHTSGVFASDLALGYWQQVTVFQAGHVDSYWQMAWNRPLSFVEYAITTDGFSSELAIIGAWSVQTYGTWSADLKVEASYDGGVNWQVITSLSSRGDANYNLPGNDLTGAIYRVEVSNYASISSTTPPRVVLTANNQFVYGLVQITAVANAYAATANVIAPLYSTNTTIYWSEGAWSEVRGYPQAVTIFQERAFYASTQFQPQRVWGTQTDDIENFALVDQSQSAYGLAFDLNAPGRGPIQWLTAQTDLMCGLAGAEWIISSGQANVAITPTQVIALEHSVNGSAPNLPGVIIGNACFYLQRKGCSFQQMLFSVFTNKYMSSDMQVLAQHLTAPRVKQFDYQQQFQNQSLLWAVCGDGSLIALTYAMDQEVFGWSKHLTGEGIDFGFISVQVIYGAPGQDDEVWVATQRSGQTHSTIERINPKDWQTEAQGQPNLLDAVFADCSAIFTSPVSEAVGPLPAVLEGRTVVASITPASGSGAWSEANLTVVGGNVDIPNYQPQPGDVVVVGLPIQWYVQPMPLDVDGRMGPIPSVTKAIRKLFVRVINSLGGGWATKEGDVIPFQWNSPTQDPTLPPALTPNLPIEIEVDVAGLTQYTEDPQFTIQGSDALPFTLLGVIVDFDVGGNP